MQSIATRLVGLSVGERYLNLPLLPMFFMQSLPKASPREVLGNAVADLGPEGLPQAAANKAERGKRDVQTTNTTLGSNIVLAEFLSSEASP